jgi:hypothetical protein
LEREEEEGRLAERVEQGIGNDAEERRTRRREKSVKSCV